ncbi:MAG: hypothetical protein AAF927_22940 [Bacteroidota bacterium]
MTPFIASIINAVCLIGLGSWGYLASEDPSPTAWIPVIVGVALLLCAPGVKKENKIIAHIAVLLTLIILLGLFMPLNGAIGRGDNMAVTRVVIMILSTILAMVYFLRSFIEARRKRNNA